jgi:hypothetical protein
MSKRIRTTSPTKNGKARPPKPRTRKATSNSEVGASNQRNFRDVVREHRDKYGDIDPSMPLGECIRKLVSQGAKAENLKEYALEALLQNEPLDDMLRLAATPETEAERDRRAAAAFALEAMASKLDDQQVYYLKKVRRAAREIREYTDLLGATITPNIVEYLEHRHFWDTVCGDETS